MATEKTDTRTRLLAAAIEAMKERGGDLEMADVAKRAGVSGGLAYHYFASKAGLLSAIIGEFYDRYDVVINERFDPAIPWIEGEQRRMMNWIRFLYNDPAAPIVLGQMGGAAEVMAVEAGRRNDMISKGARAIRKAQQAGVLDADLNADIVAAAITGGLRQAAALALAADPRPAPEKLATHLWRFCAGSLNLPSEQRAFGLGAEESVQKPERLSRTD